MYDFFTLTISILILFCPAGIANIFADLSRHIPFSKFLAKPVDLGLFYKGKPILGKNKTWRGLIFGVLAGSLFSLFVSFVYLETTGIDFVKPHFSEMGIDFNRIWYFYFAMLLSFFALVGDMIESFFKRRLNIESGKPWFPFDQTDFIISACLFSLLYVRLDWYIYPLAVLIYFVLHLIFKSVGFLIGIGKTAF